MQKRSVFSTLVTIFVSLLVVTSFVFAITTISTDVTTDGIVTVSSGTASAPSYSFVGDTNTGIFRDQADVFSFAAGGTRTLSIINGSVGIGTTNPATKLAISGGSVSWPVGVAITAANYEIARDLDGKSIAFQHSHRSHIRVLN